MVNIIAKSCPNLLTLHLESRKLSTITDDSILAITGGCPFITNLNLGRAPYVTPSCVRHISKIYSNSLKYFQVSDTKVDFDPEILRKACKHRVEIVTPEYKD